MHNLQTIGSILDKQGGLERFKGFFRPNTTNTPDEIFDRFLTVLTHAELKVLLYIVRRTFGFKKDCDHISIKQISEGIVTRTGHTLDHGAGLNRRTAIRVVRKLEEKGLITVRRARTADGYNSVNVYSLKFRER